MTRFRADLLLLLVAGIWGAAFIAQKYANDSMGPLGFVGVRFLLSFVALAPLAFFEARRASAPLDRRALMLAGVISLCLFAGSSLQQIGLVSTTATNGGFLTALYLVFVPLIVWAISGAAPRPMVFVASAISILGAWLITDTGQPRQWTSGDGLILISDVAWALWISLVPVFLGRADRPFFLACAQYGVTTVLALAAGLFFETFSYEGMRAALPMILYAGLCSGALAYTLQIFAQKYTPPAEAALIMSLESVFAAAAGALLLSERLTGPALLGCALILLGVALVEAGPAIGALRLRNDARKLP